MWNDIGWYAATKDDEVQNNIGWCTTTKDDEVWNDKGWGICPTYFMGRKYLLMKFNKIQFVYIDVDYLKYLHDIDSEIFSMRKEL